MRPPLVAIQDPILHDNPAGPGTFVILAVDPMASVRLLDEQAKLEAAAMAPVKYLALVNGYANFEYGPRGQLLTPKFLLVGHGLPPPPKSWGAIPLAPALPHPETDRQPLSTIPPLQWEDCYIHTSVMLDGLVSRLHLHRSLGPQLSPEAYKQVKRDLRADNTRAMRERRARMASERQRHAQEAPPEDITSYAADAALHEGPLVIDDLVDHGETPRMKLSFQMWMDTSSIDDFGDPYRVYEEIKRLEEIEWDWANRTVAAMLLVNKPNTEAWVNAVAGADADTDTANLSHDRSEFIEDVLRPEDAVDADSNKGDPTDNDLAAATRSTPRSLPPALPSSSDTGTSGGRAASAPHPDRWPAEITNSTHRPSVSVRSQSNVDRCSESHTDGFFARALTLSAFHYFLLAAGSAFLIRKSFSWNWSLRRLFL